MFESLKQQPRGMSPRERTGLYVKVAAAAVLGVAIFGGGVKLFTSSKDHPLVTAAPVVGRAADAFRPLDLAPLAALREGDGAPIDLDGGALKHLLAEVAFDRALRRSPMPADRAERERRRFLSPFPSVVATAADVAALDPKTSAGQLIELRGVATKVDPAGFALPALGDARKVHAMLVVGDDGAAVAVLDAELPRDRRPPEREIELHATGNMERYMWGFDGKKYSEAKAPIEFHYGERLRFTWVNDTMMEHPLHLHGMWMELDNGHGAYNPRKHTVVLKPGEKLSLNITADAPGLWAFHCHVLYHMEVGMFRVVSVARKD